MKGFHFKELWHIFLYNVKVMSKFCKSVKLWRFIKSKVFKVMYVLFTSELRYCD